MLTLEEPPGEPAEAAGEQAETGPEERNRLAEQEAECSWRYGQQANTLPIRSGGEDYFRTHRRNAKTADGTLLRLRGRLSGAGYGPVTERMMR